MRGPLAHGFFELLATVGAFLLEKAVGQRVADAEHDLSKAGAKVGPVNLSTTGEATIENKDRRDGQWNETVGSIKQAVGNVIGSQDLKVHPIPSPSQAPPPGAALRLFMVEQG